MHGRQKNGTIARARFSVRCKDHGSASLSGLSEWLGGQHKCRRARTSVHIVLRGLGGDAGPRVQRATRCSAADRRAVPWFTLAGLVVCFQNARTTAVLTATSVHGLHANRNMGCKLRNFLVAAETSTRKRFVATETDRPCSGGTHGLLNSQTEICSEQKIHGDRSDVHPTRQCHHHPHVPDLRVGCWLLRSWSWSSKGSPRIDVIAIC